MTNVKSVNFYDLCRICTATTDQKLDIFSPEGKTKNLCAKINECMPLNVCEKDRLPKVLCQQCIQNLDSYTEFRNICRNSQLVLTSCLNTASAQNGGKVLIKDILSSTGKSLSVHNNTSNLVDNNPPNNAETLQNHTSHSLNQTITSQLQQQPSQQQQLFTIQGGNVVAQSVVNPLSISSSGTLPNQDFLSSIMQAVGIQGDNLKIDKNAPSPQYTITVDNSTVQQQAPSHLTPHLSTPTKDKETRNNALEEFLKMKPNIKVTPVSKKVQYHNQQQDQQQLQQQQQQQEVQQQQLQQQQEQQQQQQNQLVQFQLQQLIQQQIQQQQLQQQLQLLTSQLQPQQITITAPALQQQTHTMLPTTTLTADNSLNDNNNELSPSKNKKPKLNFVLTPPNHISNQTLSATLPQHATATAGQNATPQIHLQFQPTLTPQSALQLQQHHQHAATAALLSNLAPLLQPQTQLNAALQTQTLSNVAQNTGTNMLSPNKCFLPITIKDENTDQQFVAHIDAKNFLLPTTYQLQMKLQPQIATADGQPIMQLAPTSIPATLQLAPQAINTNPTFQATAAVAAFNNNTTLPTQLIQQQQQQQQHQQLQTSQAQQQIVQQITNAQSIHPQSQVQASPLSQPTPPSSQTQTQAVQISSLPKNVQITSQQVLTTGIKKITAPSVTKKAAEVITTIETEKQIAKVTKPTNSQNESKNVIKQPKYKISQQPGSSTIEITPTTSFTQQIMRQVQQQQQQKQKLVQQQNTEPSTTTTVTTQHGGITVQRITTKLNSPAISTGNGANENVTQSIATRQTTINPVQQPTKLDVTATLPKIPILNKQNITISRIAPQNQLQQAKSQSQQAQTVPVSNTALKVVQQPLKSQTMEASVPQKKQQALPTRLQQQQQENASPQQHSNNLSNIPNTTLRISPVKKFIKKTPQKAIETTQTTSFTNSHQLAQPGNNPTTQKHTTSTTAPTTQVHYITDITSILPPSSNDNLELVAQTKITTIPTASTTTITSATSSIPSNPDQPKKNLECSQCGRVFKKKEHLTQHVKLHSGVRPFKCNEEGCTKAFHRKEHLLRHLVSHSGKKMFSCDICQKPFSRKDNLSKHRKIHTDPNVNNYVCEFCNKSFAVKAYYEQHKILHQNKATSGEDKKTVVNEMPAKTINQITNNNTNQIEYQTQSQQQQQQQQQQQKQITQTTQITQQQQQQQQHQQLHLVQQQIQQLQQQNQTQSQQIMHLQLPTSIVTTQDMAGNTITITQANDPQANNLKTITLSGTTAINAASGGNHHDATVLNLPTSLANFVHLSQAQFVNTTTGQIMGIKIEK